MNDAQYDANERVRGLIRRVSNLEARLDRTPKVAWWRRRELRERLARRRWELSDAVAWQELVETLTNMEG